LGLIGVDLVFSWENPANFLEKPRLNPGKKATWGADLGIGRLY
jgi:hypothetical protein